MDVVKNSVIILFSQILIATLFFLSGVIVALKFGPEGKGVFDLFISINGLVATIGGLGVGTASIYLINKEKKEPSQLLFNILVFGLFLGLILDLFVYFLSLLFPIFFTGLSKQYLLLLFLTIPFTLFHGYLLPFFIAKFKIILWSFFIILYELLIFAGIIFSVFILGFGIVGAIYSIAISSFITFLFIFLYLLKTILIHNRFNKELFIKQVTVGLTVYLGDIFRVVNQKLNIFIVNILLGIVSVGYYSVALNMSSILFFIPYAFQQTFYSSWSLSQEKEIDKNTPKIARQSLIVGCIATFLLFLAGRFLITFIYGERFVSSIMPFLILLPGMIFMIFSNVFFNNFFARGKAHITTIILLLSLSTNILLSIALIPRYGISGSTAATSFSYFIASIMAVFCFSRLSGYSMKQILTFNASDVTQIYEKVKKLFKSRHILIVTPDVNLESLTKYYNQKAIALDESIITDTFESPSFFKRIFYDIRVKKVLEFLDIRPKDFVLEVGCGVGYYTKKISKITPHLIATDISPEYVSRLHLRNPNKIMDYVACPVEKMPFENNYFDKVLMSEVIEHLLNAEDGLKEIHRVLKPGGRLLIDTPNKYSYLNILYHIKVSLRDTPFEEEHIKEFTTRELTDLLKKYFVIEKVYYLNFFPIFMPKFLANVIGFEKISRGVETIEDTLNTIPLIKKIGFITMVRLIKK